MKLLLLLLCLLFFLVTAIQATLPVATDPLVGRWIWFAGKIVTINADGTASGPDIKGTRVFTNNPEVQRKYRLVWNEGVFLNKLTLAEDQKELLVQDRKTQGQFTAERAVSAP